PYTRENQISYYLEGELALLCLDVEMRRRNNNTFGACDLMAELVRRYAIHSPDAEAMGVDYNDIRATLKSCPGGENMGPYLDRLVKQRNHPNLQRALSAFRLKLVPHASDKEGKGWLGVGLKESAGRVLITTYHAGSPLRELTQVGDEVLAVDGVRVKSVGHLKKLIAGRSADELSLDVVHEGIMSSVSLTLPASPQHGVSLKGKGNERWRNWIRSRQAP
ncbi:MAG: PDZ domain-containing protein, partial [Candidatus Thermoplasmatota archaeon]|nr:PDZ domain-containing protein [Candidatus Thermoplasmatota archaeon]